MYGITSNLLEANPFSWIVRWIVAREAARLKALAISLAFAQAQEEFVRSAAPQKYHVVAEALAPLGVKRWEDREEADRRFADTTEMILVRGMLAGSPEIKARCEAIVLQRSTCHVCLRAGVCPFHYEDGSKEYRFQYTCPTGCGWSKLCKACGGLGDARYEPDLETLVWLDREQVYDYKVLLRKIP